MHLPWMGKGGS